MGYEHNGLIVVGATSEPWNVDHGILRRFENRIYIGPPNESERFHIFKVLLKDYRYVMEENDFIKLSKISQFFSCRDIKRLVNYAAAEPLHDCQTSQYFIDTRNNKSIDQGYMEPCNGDVKNAQNVTLLELGCETILCPPIKMHHFDHLLNEISLKFLTTTSITKRELNSHHSFKIKSEKNKEKKDKEK